MSDAEKARDLERLLRETGARSANELATRMALLDRLARWYRRNVILRHRVPL